MLSFRKKILISDIIVFLIFLLILFPVVHWSVSSLVKNALTHEAKRLVSLLKAAGTEEQMLELMKSDSRFVNQPFSILDEQGKLIYRSHSEILPTNINPQEVNEAIRYGKGYAEAVAPVSHEKYAYIAIAFNLGDQKYIFHSHIIFYKIEQEVIRYEIGFTLFIALLLAVYILINQIFLHRFTRPIGQIINAIIPYQKGQVALPPRISLETIKDNEFKKLASTLNSLVEQIHKQIDSLMRQRKETEDILESLKEGVIATDENGKVVFVNQSASFMLGISRENLMRKFLFSAKTPLSERCDGLIRKTLETGETVVETFTIQDKNSFYYDLISAPLTFEKGAILVLQDKTSQYRTVEMGKDFVANASHELRTPITIIRGFAETLQDLPDLSQEMLLEITNKIVQTCIRLDKLVKSLLTLADIENLSDERMQETDLISLAENCQRTLLTAHPNVHLTLNKNIDIAKIYGESDLIELSILNLLENAVKYSQGPAHIEMSIEEIGPEVHLKITDRGIGMSQGDLTHIFERFYTVNKARSRKLGGAGLGLSIVKTIVEKHNGRIIVASELGKGSTFTIILPKT